MILTQDTSPFDETSLRYAGWRVVLACFLLALFLFGFALYGNGVYLAELPRLRGWPAAMISGAVTLSFLIGNISVIFTDELIARLGLRRLVLFGVAGLAASTALLAIVREPWQLYFAFILMSLGWTGMGTVAIAALVSRWFVRRRGLALSLAYTGGSCGGVIVAPLLVFWSRPSASPPRYWRPPPSCCWCWCRWCCCGLLHIPAECEPDMPGSAQAPMAVAQSRAAIIRQPAFWTITIPFALAFLAQVGFIVHQIALLEPGIGRPGAGLAVALTTAMALVGRLCLGSVADRFNPRWLTTLSFVTQALALLTIIEAGQAPVLLAACAAFGFSVGNLITLPPLIIHREFEPGELHRGARIVDRDQRRHLRVRPRPARAGSQPQRRLWCGARGLHRA